MSYTLESALETGQEARILQIDFSAAFDRVNHQGFSIGCALWVLDVLCCVLTWILGVASKQLRLLHGRVGDSTIVVNSLSPQMSELVEDAIAS